MATMKATYLSRNSHSGAPETPAELALTNSQDGTSDFRYEVHAEVGAPADVAEAVDEEIEEGQGQGGIVGSGREHLLKEQFRRDWLGRKRCAVPSERPEYTVGIERRVPRHREWLPAAQVDFPAVVNPHCFTTFRVVQDQNDR